MSTFGGAELGCIAAHKVLEICARPETRAQCHYIAHYLRQGLSEIQANYPDFFVGIRQRGLIMGLEFDHPEGAKYVMRACYRNGIWAIYSALDPRALQFKPGLLCDRDALRRDPEPPRHGGRAGAGRSAGTDGSVRTVMAKARNGAAAEPAGRLMPSSRRA